MIYFVRDNRNTRGLVVYTLDSTGFKAFGCGDDKAFRAEIAGTRPEPVLLGVMLSGTDDIQILRRLKADRSIADVPVITVIARGAEFEKIKSLDLGADDYAARPFGVMKLVSRVRTVLRRSSRSAQDFVKEEILTLGSTSLNLSRHAVMVNSEMVTLTLKEHQLLEGLMTQPGFIFSRDQLLGLIWGYSFHGETRMVDVYTCTLYKKLGEAARHIRTVRGVGYKVSSQGN